MAGKGGGGAWKVAYADFVTAMMAFFLVMWISGQDQKIRKAVSYYFNDPYNTQLIGTSKQANRTGSVAEMTNQGSVPLNESVAYGRGRKSFSAKGDKTPPTKLVADWIVNDDGLKKYWDDRARQARQLAAESQEVRLQQISLEEAAALRLAKNLRSEAGQELSASAHGVQQELLYEVLSQVNWFQIAEDLLSR